MEASAVAVGEEMRSGAARLAEDGKTPLFIAAGTSLLGVIALKYDSRYIIYDAFS